MQPDAPVTIFGPDFPFAYDDWVAHPVGLGTVPDDALGQEVAIIGAGMAGMVAAYELMRVGLRPVVYEPDRIGGRLRSEQFVPGEPEVAELGGMRFPVSSSAFFHYVDALGLCSRPFPNPLTEAAGSTVIDLGGETFYARTLDDLPPIYREISDAWDSALERIAGFSALQEAIRARDTAALKSMWNQLVREWDDRSSTTSSQRRKSSALRRSAIGSCSGRSDSAPVGGIRTSATRCSRSCASSSPTATPISD